MLIMSKPEAGMRSKLVGFLRRSYKLDAYPVENTVAVGMPDVVYGGWAWGWIECKKTQEWPKRASTPVRLDHELLDTQKVWIRKHTKRNGRVHVLVQIGLEFLLLNGMDAVSCLGKDTREQLCARALLHCHGWQELEAKLKEHL